MTDTIATKAPTTVAFGELILAMTDEFKVNYVNRNAGGKHPFSCWEPKVPPGFQPLGMVGLPGWNTRNISSSKPDHRLDEYTVALCVKLNPDHPADGLPALANPTGYDWVWDTQLRGGDPMKFWRPKPPKGYVALGLVASPYGTFDPPSRSKVACVREDLTYPADITWIYDDSGTQGDHNFSAWSLIVPPDYVDSTDGPARTLLAPNTFTGHPHHRKPTDLPDMRVLCLPSAIEQPARLPMPALRDHDQPVGKTSSVLTHAVWLPFTAVNDPAKTEEWKVANSPFYRIERKASWSLLAHINNQTSTMQSVTKTVTIGIEKETSKTFSATTGFSISSTNGVSVGAASSEVTATFSMELGFSHTTSSKELESTSVARTLQAPPDHAAAMWVGTYKLQVTRADGTRVGNPLPFNGESFHYDQYPDDPATSYATPTITTPKTGSATSTGRAAVAPAKRPSKHT